MMELASSGSVPGPVFPGNHAGVSMLSSALSIFSRLFPLPLVFETPVILKIENEIGMFIC